MVKQTLASGQRGRQLMLNGPLVKLGTLKNVCSNGAKPSEIGIGFTFSGLNEKSVDDDGEVEGAFPFGITSFAHTGEPATIKGTFHWRADESAPESARAELYPELSGADFRVQAAHPERPTLFEHYLRVKPSNATRAQPSRHSDFVFYSVEALDEWTRTEAVAERSGGRVIGCVMNGFMPDDLAVRFDSVKDGARQIADAMVRPTTLVNRKLLLEKASPDLIEVANDWLAENNLPIFKPAADTTVSRLRDHIKLARSRVLRRTEDGRKVDFTELRNIVEEKLAKAQPERPEIDFRMPSAIRSGCLFVRSFFALNVHYLGPLRDDPKPVYPLEALSRPDDVGVRGEHTAAVLDLNKHVTVSYIPSANVSEDGISPKEAEASLSDALKDWLAYLGVASGFETFETGVFGHELKVRPSTGGDLHDLTHVGVGVSQVLPIVVMALLAPRDSLLIFEQPELHLHPKVQARLADFFLAVSASGRQCLLETHSNFLVDRFRRRIAEVSGRRLVGSGANLFHIESRRPHGVLSYSHQPIWSGAELA